MMLQQAHAVLKDVFGYDAFRPLQQEIIANVLKKQDSLVIMPTGGGKSLCYQIPALLFNGLTVVVSPLISLMKDQVEQLTELGVGAVVLNSSLSYDAYRANVARLMRNEVKLLYLAPETLLMQKTLAMLSAHQVECLTIDEAHCISEWGHDFRPEYRQLAEVRTRFPQAVCLALTATATPRVQQDIRDNLRFERSNEFIASFDRHNLLLQIEQKANPVLQTVEFLERFPKQSGIIYCLTRKQVDELSLILANEGFSVKPYHAGLSDEARRQHQELFIRDDVQIMVATIAFGMGINKPNIRFIVHYDLPKNIESYYQQIGRAGRDGLRAHCLLLFSYGDIAKIKHFITQKDDQQQRIAMMHLNALIGFLETDLCRRIPLLEYFGESYAAAPCAMCDNCLTDDHALSDLTIPAQKFLSCVKRTDEMFGAGHIIDVLRGSQSQKVLKFNHQRLSTYNIGLEYSKKQWFHLSRQFLQKGLLTQDAEYGSLKLTPKAWDVLRGNAVFMGKVEAERQEYASEQESEQEYDHDLFEILRQKRKALADAANVPPYVIFPDKTLIDMATFFPQSQKNLITIHGVGGVKAGKYGAIFLHLIQEYCQTHQIEEKSKRQWNTSGVTSRSTRKRKYILVGEAYNAGKSAKELLTELAVKPRTLIEHLSKYLQEGYPIRKGEDFLVFSSLSPERQAAVLRKFDELGLERLKPVFEAFREQISYDELSVLRLHYLIEHQIESYKLQ